MLLSREQLAKRDRIWAFYALVSGNIIFRIPLGVARSTHPRSAQCTFLLNVQARIRLPHHTIMQINTVFVHKRRIRAFPRRDPTSASPQQDADPLHPQRPEPIEEIRLSCYRTSLHIHAAQFPDIYGVLVAEEADTIEARIGVGDAESERGAGAVWEIGVHEVDVVGAEIGVAEGSARGHSIASRTAAGEGGVERRSDGKRGGEGVVERTGGVGAGGLVPDHDNVVLRAWIVACLVDPSIWCVRCGGLAEEIDRARARDIELFGVVPRENQDSVGSGVVGEGKDSGLNGRELCIRRGPDKKGVLRASC